MGKKDPSVDAFKIPQFKTRNLEFHPADATSTGQFAKVNAWRNPSPRSRGCSRTWRFAHCPNFSRAAWSYARCARMRASNSAPDAHPIRHPTIFSKVQERSHVVLRLLDPGTIAWPLPWTGNKVRGRRQAPCRSDMRNPSTPPRDQARCGPPQ